MSPTLCIHLAQVFGDHALTKASMLTEPERCSLIYEENVGVPLKFYEYIFRGYY